jgi:hypothetical protein
MENTTPNEQKSERIIERPGARQLDDQPYTPPTPQAQARIDEIRKSPEYYTSSTKQKSLAAEMHRLMTGAPEVAREGETANEAAIRALNQSGKLTSKDSNVRADAMQELRKLLAAGATEAERDARKAAPLGVRREEYGVEDPKLPKPWLESYKTEYAAWEVPLFDLANEHGLAAEQVRGLRDAAIDLGQVVGDTGRPASEEDLKRVFDKYRVAPSAHAVLTKLWRQIEGGAS